MAAIIQHASTVSMEGGREGGRGGHDRFLVPFKFARLKFHSFVVVVVVVVVVVTHSHASMHAMSI